MPAQAAPTRCALHRPGTRSGEDGLGRSCASRSADLRSVAAHMPWHSLPLPAVELQPALGTSWLDSKALPAATPCQSSEMLGISLPTPAVVTRRTSWRHRGLSE